VKDAVSSGPFKNTDRELWRETPDDAYSPRIFVTAGGSIGIAVDGLVIVKPVREWHALAAVPTFSYTPPVEAEQPLYITRLSDRADP
jgi:hypothetical protein